MARVRAFIAHVRTTKTWKWARWPVFVGSGLFALGLITFIGLYLTVSLPKDPPALSSSVIVDANGQPLAILAKDGYRVQVHLDQVAPIVRDAVVASEDRRFYEHSGIDPIGAVRALFNDVTGGTTQGGSTITQQLVKNSYLSNERSLVRKAKEAILAIKLEQQESKDEILERYLNTVYFGRGAYGIEAAARVYFDTTAAQLAPDQAALLVGLLRAPETADPATKPDAAMRRRNTVLDDLADMGKLSRQDAEAYKAMPLNASSAAQPVTLTAGIAPYFIEWVRQQAIAKFGEQLVYGGGLTIHTTLNADDQRAAEAAIASTLTDPADPQAALVALDRDGGIRAYVGGRDFAQSQVDAARGRDGGGSGRQVGSTFKPFVLATALERGIGLATPFAGPPTMTLDTGSGPWTVDNYNHEGYGDISLLDATAHSVNTVYAQLVLQTGPQDVRNTAKAAGITSSLEAVPSIALGTDELSPLELSDAYLTFARDGEHVAPHAITSIEDRDHHELFKQSDPSPQRAIAEGPARAVNAALQEVVNRGTGTAAQLDRPVAGKTGTTQDYGDAWFAGYTPNYVAVVWMGYPEGQQHAMTDVHGMAVTGGTLPAKIWKGFMTKVVAGLPRQDFQPAPDDLMGLGPGATEPSDFSVTSEQPSSTDSTLPTSLKHPSTTASSSTTTTSTKPKATSTTSTTTTATTAPNGGSSTTTTVPN